MTGTVDPQVLAERVRRDAERALWRARNGVKHLTGIGRTPVGASPHDVVWQHDKVRLLRYRRSGTTRTVRQPVLLVYSLVSRSYILDLVPGNSVVEAFLTRGFDVYLTDWGVPDELESSNTLQTYTNFCLPRMVRAACVASGSADVNMLGYCYGGVLSLLYAAGHPQDPVRNLALTATPVDFSHMGPFMDLIRQGTVNPADMIDASGNLPASVVADSFRLIAPLAELTTYINLWENMWNSDFVEAHQTIGGWGRDHIPFPGQSFLQIAELIVRQNLLAAGSVPLGERTVHLADITWPMLVAYAEKDTIAPLAATRPVIPLLTSSREVAEYAAPGGHIGLLVGRAAHRRHLPALADWFETRSEDW